MGKKDLILIEHSAGYTVEEISAKTGFSGSTIRWAINSSGLKANKKSPGNNLDHKFQEFLLGSMLGDGCLLKDGRLSIAHCANQRDYIKHKHTFISTYSLAGKLSFNTIINDRYKNGSISEYRFKTLTSNKFDGIRQFYYPHNQKCVPSEEFLSEFLTPFAIAIWYMDDGNVTNYSFEFNTQSFSLHDCMKLRYVLLEHYDIHTTLHEANHVIMISADSRDKFISIVLPFMCKSMLYKLIPNRVLYKLGELQERCDANLQPSLNSNILEGSTTNDRVRNMDSNIDTSTQHLLIDDDIVCSIENKESIELGDKEPLS